MLAITAIHQLGVVCRETTPDNPLLDAKGHVKLAWSVNHLWQAEPAPFQEHGHEAEAAATLRGIRGRPAMWKMQHRGVVLVVLALGSWDLALGSCSTLVIFSRFRFSLELPDRMDLRPS